MHVLLPSDLAPQGLAQVKRHKPPSSGPKSRSSAAAEIEVSVPMERSSVPGSNGLEYPPESTVRNVQHAALNVQSGAAAPLLGDATDSDNLQHYDPSAEGSGASSAPGVNRGSSRAGGSPVRPSENRPPVEGLNVKRTLVPGIPKSPSCNAGPPTPVGTGGVRVVTRSPNSSKGSSPESGVASESGSGIRGTRSREKLSPWSLQLPRSSSTPGGTCNEVGGRVRAGATDGDQESPRFACTIVEELGPPYADVPADVSVADLSVVDMSLAELAAAARAPVPNHGVGGAVRAPSRHTRTSSDSIPLHKFREQAEHGAKAVGSRQLSPGSSGASSPSSRSDKGFGSGASSPVGGSGRSGAPGGSPSSTPAGNPSSALLRRPFVPGVRDIQRHHSGGGLDLAGKLGLKTLRVGAAQGLAPASPSPAAAPLGLPQVHQPHLVAQGRPGGEPEAPTSALDKLAGRLGLGLVRLASPARGGTRSGPKADAAAAPSPRRSKQRQRGGSEPDFSFLSKLAPGRNEQGASGDGSGSAGGGGETQLGRPPPQGYASGLPRSQSGTSRPSDVEQRMLDLDLGSGRGGLEGLGSARGLGMPSAWRGEEEGEGCSKAEEEVRGRTVRGRVRSEDEGGQTRPGSAKGRGVPSAFRGEDEGEQQQGNMPLQVAAGAGVPSAYRGDDWEAGGHQGQAASGQDLAGDASLTLLEKKVLESPWGGEEGDESSAPAATHEKRGMGRRAALMRLMKTGNGEAGAELSRSMSGCDQTSELEDRVMAKMMGVTEQERKAGRRGTGSGAQERGVRDKEAGKGDTGDKGEEQGEEEGLVRSMSGCEETSDLEQRVLARMKGLPVPDRRARHREQRTGLNAPQKEQAHGGREAMSARRRPGGRAEGGEPLERCLSSSEDRSELEDRMLFRGGGREGRRGEEGRRERRQEAEARDEKDRRRRSLDLQDGSSGAGPGADVWAQVGCMPQGHQVGPTQSANQRDVVHKFMQLQDSVAQLKHGMEGSLPHPHSEAPPAHADGSSLNGTGREAGEGESGRRRPPQHHQRERGGVPASGSGPPSPAGSTNKPAQSETKHNRTDSADVILSQSRESSTIQDRSQRSFRDAKGPVDTSFLSGFNLSGQLSSQELANLLMHQSGGRASAAGGARRASRFADAAGSRKVSRPPSHSIGGGKAALHLERAAAEGALAAAGSSVVTESDTASTASSDSGPTRQPGTLASVFSLDPSLTLVKEKASGGPQAASGEPAAPAAAPAAPTAASGAPAGKLRKAPRSRLSCPPELNLTHHVLQKPYEDVTSHYMLHEKELGQGQFGVIRPCLEIASGHVYACKTIHKKCIKMVEDAEDIRREVQCLLLLKNHPTIATMKDAFEDEENIHIVMEMCKGGDLFDRITARGRLREMDCAKICQSLIEALLHCHCLGIVHRDIKPENILMHDRASDSKMKLIDFGVAVFYESGKPLKEVLGTPEYMAPEVLMQSYGPEADIWSAGVVLYVSLCGVPPFWASSRRSLAESILYQEVSFKSAKWATISEDCQDLVKRMLMKSPKKRISATEILRHPWILKHCS